MEIDHLQRILILQALQWRSGEVLLNRWTKKKCSLSVEYCRKTSEVTRYFFFRFACMEPASLTIVPDIILPTVEGRQLSPENCVNSNKEVQSKLRVFCWGCLIAFIHRPKKIQQSCCGRVKTKNKVKIIKTIRKTMHGRTQSLNFLL